MRYGDAISMSLTTNNAIKLGPTTQTNEPLIPNGNPLRRHCAYHDVTVMNSEKIGNVSVNSSVDTTFTRRSYVTR